MARTDTIVAIATPSGRGGIGVIRISGPLSGAIGKKIFQIKRDMEGLWPSHMLLYGTVCGEEGEILDRGYVVRMAAPHSYTGEEVVEIQGHGSQVTLQKIVQRCVDFGARLAEPGEFTKRAYLNGKMDLVQAEAVAELIHSESEAEAKSARLRLEGKLSSSLHLLREETISILAECEADVDFPEEGLSLATRPTLRNKFEQIQILGSKLRNTYAMNQRLHSGFSIVLAGRPNVGKSSLFNALLQSDRAIVTSTPGTTRDILREELLFQGRRVRIIDTAGLRHQANDAVEKIGMDRTLEESKKADLICLVCDASSGWLAEDEKLVSNFGDTEIWLVWNKIDLHPPPNPPAHSFQEFFVSALRGDGMDTLTKGISKKLSETFLLPKEGGISNDRQRELLDEYLEALEKAKIQLQQEASPEFIAFELRHAYVAISRLLGKDETMEEVLGQIFSKFCVGK